jgi:hypothetical protein
MHMQLDPCRTETSDLRYLYKVLQTDVWNGDEFTDTPH